ncbi:amino acid ABC transporter substrate-binding protein [Alginatibacterium sediminis]|uniref:Amino acid ABC transporter substrate-binding protein n=1 Tax=Alginatibacterium sediminis TaxID=2164068 RepID=A0A420ENG8_9ALTE|nr:amino acid ABC transporter substrate-binding protein [Alginatibacterium sediminis]RKF22257.1 amino acid ABC transporter substrate-binding protein [Alginatibacterium sediminis]
MNKSLLLAIGLLLSSTTISAQELIKVGMSGRYFPFTFVKQDKLQGFEVDIWDEIAARNDWKVEYVTSNFSGLFGMLETGRINTISNQITITQARLDQYIFSSPYVIDGAQIVVRKGNDEITELKDLYGKKVAVNLGSNFEQLLRKNDVNQEINIITYDTGIEQDVALGRSDAFVMDRVSSLALIKESGLPLQLAGEPFETIQNAMPFLNNEQGIALQQKVNATLASMAEDGTLTTISQRWFDADITR